MDFIIDCLFDFVEQSKSFTLQASHTQIHTLPLFYAYTFFSTTHCCTVVFIIYMVPYVAHLSWDILSERLLFTHPIRTYPFLSFNWLLFSTFYTGVRIKELVLLDQYWIYSNPAVCLQFETLTVCIIVKCYSSLFPTNSATAA